MKSTRSRALSVLAAATAAVVIPLTCAGTASADTTRTHAWVTLGGMKYDSGAACLKDNASWAFSLGYSKVRCIGPSSSGTYTIQGWK
ncbi:hypothetical protein ACFVQ0_07725 [Streptomyces sp. NPDC057900]|uniref:hypothetical protein n=1 Tax=Streptomyces sp. NPDC057900 TaxID=3346274 RepID=UPI0036E1F1A6